LDHQNKL